MNKLVKKHFYLHAFSYPFRCLEVRGLERKYGRLKYLDDALIILNPKAHENPSRKFKTALASGVAMASLQDAPLEIAVGSAMKQSEGLRKICMDI